MNSVPHVGERWEKGVSMSEAETREFTMKCCKFSARCQYATRECFETRPPMRELGDERRVLCYHPR
jgi:ABC-type dipeptide/oligopeptide/nickel transport system ATPase component